MAQFVHVIHTSNGYGTREQVGHQDIWVSFNKPSQPGCLPDPDPCSHMRVVDLYAESILSQTKFKTSTVCSNRASYEWNFCNCNSNCNHMCHYADRTQVSGDYYLETNSKTPFSLN